MCGCCCLCCCAVACELMSENRFALDGCRTLLPLFGFPFVMASPGDNASVSYHALCALRSPEGVPRKGSGECCGCGCCCCCCEERGAGGGRPAVGVGDGAAAAIAFDSPRALNPLNPLHATSINMQSE